MRVAIAILISLGCLAPVRGGDAAPLTNEEVVRMLATGSSDADVLAAIAARPPAFDLHEDMIDELRLAGVSPKVLAAMRERQPAERPAPSAERPVRGKLRVAVRLDGPAELKLPKTASADLAERLRLPAAPEAHAVRDLAVFLACTTAEHVPDQWRGKTPLGRDLVATTRHEILAFVAGDTPAGATPRLALPPQLDVDLDDVEKHDLVLGIAARVGDRWYTLAGAKRAGVQAVRNMPPLTGHVARGAAAFAFDVKLDPPQRAKDTSLETPASSIVTP